MRLRSGLLLALLLGVGHAIQSKADILYSVAELGIFGSGINNAGQVTGNSNNGHAVIYNYNNGQITDLGTLPGGCCSGGNAINNLGQVTGSASTASGPAHAFLYSNGRMRDLGTLPGDIISQGLAINNAGQVTGISYRSGSPDAGHAFLYSNGQMLDLNDLIDPALGITLARAGAINDNGQILANDNPAGIGRSYLLTPTATPVPEPSTLALCGVALLGLAAGVRAHRPSS